MSVFFRARSEAHRVRALLLSGRAGEAVPAKEVLADVETKLGLGIQAVPPGYPDLGGGSAVLRRDQKFIYVSTDIPFGTEQFFGLLAHELGHWFLDPTGPDTTVAHLANLAKGDGPPAVVKVEAYGVRERKELQANVFARELLLPRAVARKLAPTQGARATASTLSIPLEFARQQMLDAVLLPEGDEGFKELKPPSPDQQAAAQAPERRAHVIAGPGTGKTSTLIHRVKWLVEEKAVHPGHILVLTFTNKAALELIERLRGAGVENASDIWAGTFHAFGLEFLRKYHQHFGLTQDVHVGDDLNSVVLLARALPKLELRHYKRVLDPLDWLGPIVETIHRCKEDLISPAEYRKRITAIPGDEELRRRREDVATLYECHEDLLAHRKQVDYVDLLLKPTLAIRKDRALYSELADKFQHVLVDEYQDVTPVMVEFLRQIAQKSKSLWVVGDVRQAIHHWRGASVKSLLKFDAHFKAHGERVPKYPLDNNRRSVQEIVDVVSQAGRTHALQAQMPLTDLVAEAGRSGEKPTLLTCTSRQDIPLAVISQIKQEHEAGLAYREQAVLCRWHSEAQSLVTAADQHGIPVLCIGELSQRPEVKTILCLMQLLVEREPKALIGLLATPELAMPLKDIERLREAAKDIRFQRGRWLTDLPKGLSATAAKVIERLNNLMAGRNRNASPWDLVCDLVLEHHLGVHLDDASVEAAVGRIALWQFAYSVRNGDGDMREARLARYLMRQRLRSRLHTPRSDRELPPEAAFLPAVRLNTVHSAKGLEYEAVHLAYVSAEAYGAEGGTWRPESIEDIAPPELFGSTVAEHQQEEAIERNNLFYVALSRARRRLTLYRDGQFAYWPQQIIAAMPLYEAFTFGPASTTRSKGNGREPSRAFSPPSSIGFDEFITYSLCPLQWWYSQELGLRSEDDVGPELRARGALMRALRALAEGEGTATETFKQAWESARLPGKLEDPSLYRDAVATYKVGVAVMKDQLDQGAEFAELTSTVGGLEIRLPWGWLVKGRHISELTLVRFAFRRDVVKLLRPILTGLAVPGTASMQLRDLATNCQEEVKSSRSVPSTDAFKAAVRFLAGSNAPSPGSHCTRCAFVTICPSAPSLK